MSFGKHLESLVNKGRDRLEKSLHGGQHYPASEPGSSNNNNNYGPPPIPTYSKPGHHAPSPAAYFQPTFTPTTPVTATFRHELGAHGWGNNELQNYVDSAQNSFHTPTGQLVIRAIANSRAAAEGQRYTSARLTSHQTLERDRGALTVRLSAPRAAGIWPAFWLLPADPFTWPTDGEVDIFESWNGDGVNHSCLHWGFFNGEDAWKHRVRETGVEEMARPEGVTYQFVWQQWGPGQGRLVWLVQGRPVMRAEIPAGTRRLADFRIIVNVAMGGNVCAGQVPADGAYDLVVHELRFEEEPLGGWEGFERVWSEAQDGHTM